MTGWSGRLSLSSFRGRQMRSRLQLDIRNLSLGRRHLVNAYEVKAGIGVKVIAGNTVWSMPKRLRGFTTRRYINPLYLYVTLPYRSATLGYSRYKMPIRPQFALVDPWPRSIDTNRRWRSTWKCTWRRWHNNDWHDFDRPTASTQPHCDDPTPLWTTDR